MKDERSQPDFSLEPEVAEALRAVYGRAPMVPVGVDEAILDRARRDLEARRRFRPWLMGMRIGAGLATAAGLALAVWVAVPRWAGAAKVSHRDLDGDGRVDVVDALWLTRAIDAGAGGVDVNGDGLVDRSDVDAIAAFGVRLDGGAM